MTSEQTFQLLLVALGIGGTIIGSLAGALGGALYQARLSRSRLKVIAALGVPLLGGQIGARIVTISAANVGPLPMQVVSCGLALSTRFNLTLVRDDLGLTSLPADVAPGHSADMRIYFDQVLEGLQEQADERKTEVRVLSAWARDGTGKIWHGRVLIKDMVARPRT